MRPTKLNFRSPKEKTGEITYPLQKHDGTNLDISQYHNISIQRKSPEMAKRFSTFSKEQRFSFIKVLSFFYFNSKSKRKQLPWWGLPLTILPFINLSLKESTVPEEL